MTAQASPDGEQHDMDEGVLLADDDYPYEDEELEEQRRLSGAEASTSRSRRDSMGREEAWRDRGASDVMGVSRTCSAPRCAAPEA